MNINIHSRGIIYSISRELYESDESFYQRSWFIVNKKPDSNESFKKIEKLSFIWRNHTIFGMSYSPSIIKQIEIV
jgi:hypothetical protein